MHVARALRCTPFVLALAGCGSTMAAPAADAPAARASEPARSPATAPSAPKPPTLAVRVKPELQDGVVKSARIALRYEGTETPGTPFAVGISEVFDDEPGWIESVRDVVVRDDDGAVPVKRTLTKDDDGDDYASWQAERPTRGAVHVEYAIDVDEGRGWTVTGTRRWPGGGFEATAGTFILLPREAAWKTTWDVAIEWDTTRPATTSYGDGNLTVKASRQELAKTVFFSGFDGRFMLDQGDQHLRSAWIGDLAFEVPDVMGWIARADHGQRALFAETDTSPFTVFFVASPSLGESWVGIGHTRSFVLHAGAGLKWERTLRFVLAHELVHRWIGVPGSGLRLDGRERSAYWLTEGFTVHFTRAHLLHDRLATATEAVDDLNERTLRYFANPSALDDNDAIIAKFATSLDHQNLPYDRGMLYAAELDAALRAKSGGARTVGTLVVGLLEEARAEARKVDPARPRTKALPAARFREAVEKELGPEGAKRFDAVIVRGERPDPPSDAFGPCIRRKARKVHQYDLGFAIRSFSKKTITELRPGSAAARAGLKEGQKFLRSKGEIGKPDISMQITIDEGGKERVVEFSPKGPAVDGFVWERVPKVDEATCARKP